MSKMKKVFALALAVMMSLSLVACGGGDKKPDTKTEGTKSEAKTANGEESIYTPNGSYPIVKEPIELSVFTFSMPNLENYETNDFTKYMEEKTILTKPSNRNSHTVFIIHIKSNLRTILLF